RKGSEAVRRSLRRSAAGDAGGPVAADPGPCLHDLRTETRLRDWLPAIPPLPDHRSRRRIGPDVDGYDDAAPGRSVAAVQVDLFRAGRRLVAGGGEPGAELRRQLADWFQRGPGPNRSILVTYLLRSFLGNLRSD